jgi:hypothetical protein
MRPTLASYLTKMSKSLTQQPSQGATTEEWVSASGQRAPALALLRVHLTYLWRHKRTLSLKNPRRFTELVQWRKLYERTTPMSHFVDKLAVKAFVAQRLGPDWITPTIWSGTILPESPPWQRPFVVKSSHGCNQRRIVRDGSESWDEVRRASMRWMRSDYGRWLDEHAYVGIPRSLMVEPFIGVGGVLPIDYKFYVFHGRVAFIQVHLDREHKHRWLIFNREWIRASPADV